MPHHTALAENYGPDAPPEREPGAFYNFEAHAAAVKVASDLRKAAVALRGLGDCYSAGGAIALFEELSDSAETIAADLPTYLVLADEREGGQ